MKKLFFLSCLICLILFCTLIISHVRAQDMSEDTHELWTVRQGDTLWLIAKEHRGKTEIRKYIYQIQELNDIKATIYPGQELLLP